METTNFQPTPTQPFSDSNQENNKEVVSSTEQDEAVYQMLFVARQGGKEVLVVEPIREIGFTTKQSMPVFWVVFWLGFVGGVAFFLYFIYQYLMKLHQLL